MARKLNPVLWNQWRQRLERQRVSRLPITAFCRREGVSPAVFHAWKRKLRNSASARRPSRDAATEQRPRKRHAKAPQRRASHVSLPSPATPAHPAEFLQLPVQSVRSSPWIELMLIDGTIVRVPQENLAALTTLLKLLRGGNSPAQAEETSHA